MAKNETSKTAETLALEDRVTRVEKMVAYTERKRQEMSDNWKKFVRQHIQADGDGKMSGRVQVFALAALLLVSLGVGYIVAENFIKYSDNDYWGDAGVGIVVQGDLTVHDDIVCDAITATGALSVASVSTAGVGTFGA